MGSVFEDIRIGRQKTWELVTASVVGQRVMQTCNKGVAFNVELSYAYHLGHVAGEGTAVLPVDGCLDAAQIAAFTVEHPIGSPIAVRVDPKNATESRSDAEVETSRPIAISFFLGLGFFILFIFQWKTLKLLFSAS